MSLPDIYVQIPGQLSEIFKRISEGQAPEKFSRQYLKDLGFQSPSYHAVIPLLKTLGFLADDGSPTARYHSYRDGSQSRRVLGQSVREAYADLFTIKAEPNDSDRSLIEGKFKSAHNTTDRVAKLMASTFFSLLPLGEWKTVQSPSPLDVKATIKEEVQPEQRSGDRHGSSRASLHYNIQIHLPSTKDVEVFNAIFKSLREHLLD
ncbi:MULTISPECIES: DUF5343 domain-containing protein [unclassified Bradyrhizobium]|uniref:DUF5343 domain-containing protein n=1 Tax=unclassified Bradyrhizobium TaxID=2631580 RepID=UPI0024E15105|nr:MULTISPECIES: DUF5343 domain-containing protein [unclassified Bradyrhizobium]